MAKVGLTRQTGEFSIASPTTRYLWRLASAEELYKLDTLLDGGLYMARLDQFKDPREGALGRRTKSLLDKTPSYEKRYIIREYKNARRQSFASCWHGHDTQPSEYVWNQFGGGHKGFAIRTTPYKLGMAIKSVIACGAGHIGAITYKNHDKTENTLRNILDAHFVVRHEFEEEAEVRFLIHTFGPHGQRLCGQKGPKGQLLKWRLRRTTPPIHECVGGYRRGTAILLRVDAKQLVDEVVVGKLASPALVEKIERRALNAGIRCWQNKDRSP
jgi:hypothetical protein